MNDTEKKGKSKMKNVVLAVLSAGIVATASAAGFEPGKGVANDLAEGRNERDVTFVQRGGGNAYGWRSYDLPIGVTVLPWSIPNDESSVYGLRVNLGWGGYVNMYGLDSGLFSLTTGDFGGFTATVFGNSVGGSMGGVQIGAVNFVQGGTYGLQIGVVNFAGDLHGVQIGVLNFNDTGVKCLPIINAGF